jgi:hypothetical protein
LAASPEDLFEIWFSFPKENARGVSARAGTAVAHAVYGRHFDDVPLSELEALIDGCFCCGIFAQGRQ